MSDITSLLQVADSFTDIGAGGVLGIIILLIIGTVLFFMSRSYGTERAFGMSSFIVAVCAIFLKIIGLINNYVLGGSIIIALIGFYLIMKEAGQFD